MNEAQDFREKRLAETLARALVEAIRQMQDASASVAVGASVAEPITTQTGLPSPGPAPRQSDIPAGTAAPVLGPPETRRFDDGGASDAAASKSWSEPLAPPVQDLEAWKPVTPLKVPDMPLEPSAPPATPHDVLLPPVPSAPPATPPLPTMPDAQSREPEPAIPPVAPRYLPLEPIESLEPAGPMSSRDPLGDRATAMAWNQRTRAYDETVGMVANARMEYDARFRDYRRTEYEVTERVMRDLAEDQRRLESLYRAFASCRGTITDANV